MAKGPTMIGKVVVVLALGCVFTKASPLLCYYNPTFVGGIDSTDECEVTTLTTILLPCEKDTHHCISVSYGGNMTGLGCVPKEDGNGDGAEPITCNILKTMGAEDCSYCDTDLCNACDEGVKPDPPSPLECYVDYDLAGVNGGKDDGKASCMVSDKTTTGAPCYKGYHHCASLLFGGKQTGLGCISVVDNQYNPVSCNIMQALDPRIEFCDYCDDQLCNTCSDDEVSSSSSKTSANVMMAIIYMWFTFLLVIHSI